MGGGASHQMKEESKAQDAFYKTMVGQQESQFANQTDLLNTIRGVWTPILQAGPSQEGFSPAMDQALKAQITDQTAAATANAINAQELREKQETGGAPVLPSGAQAQLEEQAKVLGQQAKAAGIQKETVENYATGRQNFLAAQNALSGTAELMNPVAYSGEAVAGGKSAFDAANAVSQANQAGSFGNIVGGIVGGGLDAFAGGLGGGLGKKI